MDVPPIHRTRADVDKHSFVSFGRAFRSVGTTTRDRYRRRCRPFKWYADAMENDGREDRTTDGREERRTRDTMENLEVFLTR